MFKNIPKVYRHLFIKSDFRNFSGSLKLCKYQIMKIGTHDGVFHCDEVLACFMLKRLPEYKDAEIVRTRDPEKLKSCDIVVDVGAEFNHDKKRYDHHQREFTETLSSLRPELGDKYKIKLSSAGLIYAFYGENVLKQIAPNGYSLSPEDLRLIYKKVYENLVEEMDAIDNGVPMTDDEPRYKIRTHLSARIHRLNPEWNSEQNSNVDKIFETAMALVSEEFLYTVNYFMTVWLPARDYVKSALEERMEVHESGQILEFKERFPWKEHLFDLEEELGIGGEIKYVIFKDKPNSWRVQAVPVKPTSFVTRFGFKMETIIKTGFQTITHEIQFQPQTLVKGKKLVLAEHVREVEEFRKNNESYLIKSRVIRKPLNKRWWGVRDDILSEVSGIKDCIFCHSTGFIGGNATRTGALAMAVDSLSAV